MEGTWPSGARTIDRRYRIRTVCTFFFLHLAISSLALSAEDPKVPSEVLDTRTVLVLQWTHTSVRAPLGQVPSTLRYSRDKFYQAPSFSCVQHWKIERSLGTRLAHNHEASSQPQCWNRLCIKQSFLRFKGNKTWLLLGGATSIHWLEYCHGCVTPATIERLLVYTRDPCYPVVSKRDVTGSLFSCSEISAPCRSYPTEKKGRGLRYLV